MENCEAMTSSTHSFAYSYRLVKKCFLKNCETSKCHNFLIFQPIFIRFSVFCSKFFTLSSEIKLNLVWISSLSFTLKYGASELLTFHRPCIVVGEKLQWATAQLQPDLTFSKLNISTKQHYTWTHILNSNVYVGLLKPMCSFGKWWKWKISLMGFIYRDIWVLKALWMFLSETINFLRILHKTNIFGMPPKILP